MKYDDIIVGAGIAGIVAGLLKVQQGRKVLLIDNSQEAGGLMRTKHTKEGYSFDYGTHLLCELKDTFLDKLLFVEVRNNDWLEFDNLQSGHYIQGQLCALSPAVNAEVLKPELYYKGLYELIDSLASSTETVNNLSEQIKQKFGHTISEQLILPAIEKLFFQAADTLVPDSHLLFGLSRVQGFSEESARILKKLPELDQALSFRSFHEGKTGQARYYPRQGGIGAWVTILLDKYKSLGGTLSLGEKITAIGCADNKVDSLTLNTGIVRTDSLTWTVPLFSLINLLSIKLERPVKPLRFLDSYLIHLVIDNAPCTGVHYYCNYDPDVSHFRATLYSNIQDTRDEKEHRVTVEVFQPNNSELCKPTGQSILRELITCGVFPSNSRLCFEDVNLISNSFPVPTHAFKQAQQDQVHIVTSHLKNVELFGKARGDIFFMNDVIMDVYKNVHR
ncbi:NAD(P)-binding protein [Pseudoalteromonas aurantia]|nr:NAD(P)-binding protein [Pseudoalteromonas aurantia]